MEKNEGNTHSSIITKHIQKAFKTIIINREEPSSISIKYDCPKSASTYNNKQKYLELEYMCMTSSAFAKYHSELNKYLIIKYLLIIPTYSTTLDLQIASLLHEPSVNAMIASKWNIFLMALST